MFDEFPSPPSHHLFSFFRLKSYMYSRWGRSFVKTRKFITVKDQYLRLHRMLKGRVGLMPDFIIIGAQRCGTTSLYNYLSEHPCVAPVFHKAVYFFDFNFQKGVAWYRSHFPSFLWKNYFRYVRNQNLITGEGSGYYIFHPLALGRILRLIPHAKLIVLLRNPVDRAYSHYNLEVRIGNESLSFEGALEAEDERLRGEREKMLANGNYYSFNHRHYSYLSRGIYVDQLKLCMSLFPKEQILLIKCEDLFSHPRRILKEVHEYLKLPKWQLEKYRKHNAGTYKDMDTTTRKRLIDYFEPHNQRLYAYIGVNYGWDR